MEGIEKYSPRSGLVQRIAAANSHRTLSFDRAMKFEHHLAVFSPPPVAVAELTSEAALAS